MIDKLIYEIYMGPYECTKHKTAMRKEFSCNTTSKFISSCQHEKVVVLEYRLYEKRDCVLSSKCLNKLSTYFERLTRQLFLISIAWRI